MLKNRRRGGHVAACAGTAAALALLVGAVAGALPVSAETVRRAGLVISFTGAITPMELPRDQAVPIEANLQGKVRSADGRQLPRLQRLSIEINRHAKLNLAGLPVCPLAAVKDARTADALANCRGSLVGKGRFGVQLAFPDHRAFHTKGQVLAFNSRFRGQRAVLVHVHTRTPAAVVVVIPLTIKRRAKGDFGFVLQSPDLPKLLGRHIYTTDFNFSLGREFTGTDGIRRSYLSAACPAPSGFPGAIFNLARATFRFDDGRQIKQTLTRNCRVASQTEQGRNTTP